MPRKGSLKMEDKIDAMINDVQGDVQSDVEPTVETTEEPTAKEATEEATEEKIEKSYLEVEPEEERQERNVPVSALQKERSKRHAAEAQLKELIESQSGSIGDDDISSLLGDPDDLVDGKTVLQIVKQSNEKAVRAATEAMQAKMDDSAARGEAQKRATSVRSSEDNARKQFDDFDDVISTAVGNGFLTEDELRTISKSKNPGAILYRKSKETLSILGVQPSGKGKTNVKETPVETEPDTDDNIYAEYFDKTG